MKEIEPLTQSDIISANPIPVYTTNFIGGAMLGIIVALMHLVNNIPGTATSISGLAIMFAYNRANKVRGKTIRIDDHDEDGHVV